MSTLQQLRDGLGRAWDQLAEGWQQLRERTSQALTRFNPVQPGGDLQSVESQIEQSAARWGLLAAEVSDDADSVMVRLEIPGMERDDFDIEVYQDTLVVRGAKRARRIHREGRYHLMECAYGAFERAVRLPAPVDESRAAAKYRRGVLTVTLPKVPGAVGRRIEVRES